MVDLAEMIGDFPSMGIQASLFCRATGNWPPLICDPRNKGADLKDLIANAQGGTVRWVRRDRATTGGMFLR